MIKLKPLLSMSGKTALVTGGSRGLGLQIAEALGEMGCRVLITARKKEELRQAVEHLGKHSIDALGFAADNLRSDSAASITDFALGKLGTIDVLVNNAGATWGAASIEHPIEAWDKVMNLNVRSVFLLSTEVARRAMIPSRSGRIINVASIAGLKGNPPGAQPTPSYNASKAALINLTRALASEWGEYGITVNALAPGMFPSKMTNGTIEAAGEAAITALTPLKRMGDDGDLKGAALLLASAAGKHITGQVLAVDGGRSAV
ncbi:SDR family oxidoreductase [Alcaligenaceae bacterium]|nr:SDR family oxidoreductase [Alcaligenaceae bacterium]